PVVSVHRYEETVVPAENPQGQGQAAAGKRRQLAVAIHVADDNVAGGVISEVASQVRIEKLQFQIRSLRPFPDWLEIRQDEGRDSLIAQVETIVAGGGFSHKLQSVKTPAGNTSHAPGTRLIQLGFVQSLLRFQAVPLGKNKVLFRFVRFSCGPE